MKKGNFDGIFLRIFKINREKIVKKENFDEFLRNIFNSSFTRLGVVIAKNLNLSGSMWINPWLEKSLFESVELIVQDSPVLQPNFQSKDFRPFYCKKFQIYLKRSKGGQRPTERSVFKFFFQKLAVL